MHAGEVTETDRYTEDVRVASTSTGDRKIQLNPRVGYHSNHFLTHSDIPTGSVGLFDDGKFSGVSSIVKSYEVKSMLAMILKTDQPLGSLSYSLVAWSIYGTMTFGADKT
jgi:hypothetical protein